MGGARHYPYPKWVLSPAGGWWYNPPQWGRNLGFTAVGAALFFGTAFAFGSRATGFVDNQAMTIHYPETDARSRLQLADRSERLKSTYTFVHTVGEQSKLEE